MHAQYVFTTPKLLRPIFKYHRRHLGLLCNLAWQALMEMFQEVASDPSALPGVVITVQSYGDRLNLHPHIHALGSNGVWFSDGSFEPIPALDCPQLMLLFRQLRENSRSHSPGGIIPGEFHPNHRYSAPTKKSELLSLTEFK